MGILITGVIILAFGSLALRAVLAFMTGEALRDEQRKQVERYVADRTAYLRRRRERSRAQLEARRDAEAAAPAVRGLPELPEDQQLIENIRFVKQVALKAPAVFSAVVRTFMSGDPATESPLRHADLLDPLDEEDRRPSEP